MLVKKQHLNDLKQEAVKPETLERQIGLSFDERVAELSNKHGRIDVTRDVLGRLYRQNKIRKKIVKL